MKRDREETEKGLGLSPAVQVDAQKAGDQDTTCDDRPESGEQEGSQSGGGDFIDLRRSDSGILTGTEGKGSDPRKGKVQEMDGFPPS